MSYDIFFVRRDPGQTMEDALADVEASYEGGDPGPLTDDDLEQWEALLDVLRSSAGDAARRLRAGEITACPERCTTRGCAYPGICRAPETAAVVPQ